MFPLGVLAAWEWFVVEIKLWVLVEAEVGTIVASEWVIKDVAKSYLWLGLHAFPPTVAASTNTTPAHRIS